MPTAIVPLKKKTRVVVAEDLPGVPEGTAGKVHRTIGLTLPRYRVSFDNGVDRMSVAHEQLVREGEWDDFKADRARKAEVAEASASSPPADAGEGAGGGDGGGEAKAPADDRLAALLARSKAAKEKKLAEG